MEQTFCKILVFLLHITTYDSGISLSAVVENTAATCLFVVYYILKIIFFKKKSK